MLGHHNQFLKPDLLMKRCMKILNAAFLTDTECACQNNLKVLERAIFWCLFWAIGSSLPKSNM